jgi:hypothetical protein
MTQLVAQAAPRLVDMGYDLNMVHQAITTLPTDPQYPLRSLKNSLTPFYSTLIPLPLDEFTMTPVVVAASLTTVNAPILASDVHPDDIITVTFSMDPFGP